MTDEQKNAIDHAQKILRAVKLYDLAALLTESDKQEVVARGVIVLQNAVLSLREFGEYVDEDGEDTDALDTLCQILDKGFEMNYSEAYEHLENNIKAIAAGSDKQEAVYQSEQMPGVWMDISKEVYDATQGRTGWNTRKLYAHPIASADVRDAETPKQSWVSWASDELIRHRAKGSADELQAKRFHMAVKLGLLEFEDVEQIDAAIAANRASEEGEKS
ncbi:hypothetical protein [Caballeronia sp. LZ001]|uniref:hypothetical protein n=1 Tax=Caballeronia sp. LZ001 TaxID=3038553 RepID=UPI0028608868|nr:hypothetical protein [Caballeronia sp. LZ001]MDR5801155.1 hypothetical protein [Caballeronia sp. LZ001]